MGNHDGTPWKPTFRCGWRYVRASSLDPAVFRDDFLFSSAVEVRRGEWRWRVRDEHFDGMSDEEFSSRVTWAYREHMFERLQQDLDVLARQLVGELEQRNGMIVTGVPYDDITAALYRWQKAKRDMPEAAT